MERKKERDKDRKLKQCEKATTLGQTYQLISNCNNEVTFLLFLTRITPTLKSTAMGIGGDY